jgi:protein-tyrosine phosphatase
MIASDPESSWFCHGVVLRERGISVDSLPREVVAHENSGHGPPRSLGSLDRGKDDSESFRDLAAASGASMRPARGVRWGSMLSFRSWSQARKRTSISLTNRPRPKVSGLGFRALPIPDCGVPPSREALAELADQLVAALRSCKTVVVHCRQGIGRSAMIVAAALIAGEVDVGTAVKHHSAITTSRRPRDTGSATVDLRLFCVAVGETSYPTTASSRRRLAPRLIWACVPCMLSCSGVKVPCPGVRGAEGQGKRKGVTARWGLKAAWNERAGRGTRTRYEVWYRRGELARDSKALHPQLDGAL